MTQDYPKSLISVYIRTNDNSDRTLEILEQFVIDHRGEYARMVLNSSNVNWLALGMTPPSPKPTPNHGDNSDSSSRMETESASHDTFNANEQLNYQGKWNERKLRVMGLLRQEALDQAWTWKTDCLFVSDADNFGNDMTIQ
jgi:hypothetical protein